MSWWREKTLRAVMAVLSLVVALFVAVPPQGVCVRELFSKSRCCLAQVPSSEPLKACCAAHARMDGQEQDCCADEAPLAAPSAGRGALCMVTSTDPWLTPSPSLDADAGALVAVAFLPLEQLSASAGMPAGARLAGPETADAMRSPALRRGSSVLRI